MEQNNENIEGFRHAAMYLVCLIGSALREEKAPEKPDIVEWGRVYQLAKKNSVEGLSYFGVETLEEGPPQEMKSKWRRDADKVLFRQLHFDEEREQILQQMRKSGLSFLPLKGIYISEYYPKPGMRSMADNDILYGYVGKCPDGGYQNRGSNEKEREQAIREAQKQMIAIMKTRGFEEDCLLGNHDIFLKQPFYNFEMHRTLVDETNPFFSYYVNPWKRAVQDAENPYLYYFSDEDEYLFFLIHLHKHFTGSGCGIRNLADEYVFLQKKEKTMNWSYLQEELEKLELTEFERQMRTLSRSAFDGGKELTGEEEEMLYYFVGCGTYGNMERGVENQMEHLMSRCGEDVGQARRKYWLTRFCVSEEKCKAYYPFFYKHRCLRPFLLPYRIVKGVIVHPAKLWREWKTLRRIK